jgi:putative transposase
VSILPRKKREWYPGAVYHITNRGNHRNDIFRDGEDYLVYLAILKESLDKFKSILYCYCLMTNHVHLIIKTTDIEIGQLMKNLNSLYTKSFNIKYNLVGHLYQGRYFSEPIENDSYVLEASKYVHLNPVKAKMVNRPEEYQWSSYGMYIGTAKEKLISSDSILGYFKGNSRLIYKEYVEGGLKFAEEGME